MTIKMPPIKVANAATHPDLKHDKKQYRPSFNKLELLNLSAALTYAATANGNAPELLALARKMSVYNMKANLGAVQSAYEISGRTSLAASIADIESEAATMRAEVSASEITNSAPLTKEESWSKAYAEYQLTEAPLINLSHDKLAMVCEHMYLHDMLTPEAEKLAELGEGPIEILTAHINSKA